MPTSSTSDRSRSRGRGRSRRSSSDSDAADDDRGGRGRGRRGGGSGESSSSGRSRSGGSKESRREMLVNVLQPEECRIAIVEDGRLEELYLERSSRENYVNNIYKARVVNVEPSIQAAFVDFGEGRNGFLHLSDVEYQYYKHLQPDGPPDDDDRGGGPKRNERKAHNKPPIQEILKRGSEVLVQVIKEGIGTKGPTLSTYISIPGRYLVLMPALGRVGVSRKIEDEEERRNLKRMLRDLDPPEGVGFIIRTAGMNRSQADLKRDLDYLVRLWKTIVKKVGESSAPATIYEESDMMLRTIRDIFSSEIDRIHIDSEEAYDRADTFMRSTMPRQADRLTLYEGDEPLFTKFEVESEIARIQSRTVALKGGGSIVIDQTEALVAIDVNSGSTRGGADAEESAYQVNLRAAAEIARQLRLRDLGGVIVNDFIDMRHERHRRGLLKEFEKHLERDRARTRVCRPSPFGLIEMTRQRIRPSLQRALYDDCPGCQGTGRVKTPESMAIEVMRVLLSAAGLKDADRLKLSVHENVADYLNNRKRKQVTELEEERGVSIEINARDDVGPEYVDLLALDGGGRKLGNVPSAPSQGTR